MKIEAKQHFEQVSPDEILALMCDEAFQRAKAERLGARSFSFSLARSPSGGISVITQRSLPRTRMPEFVKTHVLGSLKVTETERWSTEGGSPRGDFEVQVQGAPVRMTDGRVSIDGDSGGSTLTFAGVVQSTTPFFRAQIAQAGSATILETIRAEFALLRERLQTAPTEPASDRTV